VVERVLLHPQSDLWIVTEWLRYVPDFSYKKARHAKASLLERRADPDKVNHVSLCWWRLKVLYDAFSRQTGYRNYIVACYRLLFLLENQEEYQDWLDFYIGQKLSAESGKQTAAKPKSNFGHLSRDFVWDKYVTEADIPMEHLLSISLFPFWDVEKENKTMKFCFIPLEPKVDLLRPLIRSFLEKYSPKKLFIPSYQCCLRVSNKKYNDGGVVRHDYEQPTTDWNSSFKFQSFMTGRLSRREVWLPGRITKMSNTFWFSVFEQIVRRVPYYANNFDRVEDLHKTIKKRLNGYFVQFDLSAFGLQFPRQYLEVLVEELQDMYISSPELEGRVSELKDLLREVFVEMPDGTFIKPDRGIGLGYYEVLKTIIVLSILDHTNPISIFGDQGIVPFSMKERAKHPGTLLKNFGFIFDKPEKCRILSNMETGILWAGAWMTPNDCIIKKSWSSLYAGALESQYHWERKGSLQSIVDSISGSIQHIWKFLSFQYELYYGYEFFASESLGHFDNQGVNPDCPRNLGMTKDVSINRIHPPTEAFSSQMTRSLFPTRDVLLRSVAKSISIKRYRTWQRNIIIDTSLWYYSNPKVSLNNSKRPIRSAVARATPFWLATRELLLNGVDTGTISYDLEKHDRDRAIQQYPLAENPFQVKATGGYSLNLQPNVGIFGTTTEHAELCRLFDEADKGGEGHFVYRQGASLPADAHWDPWIKDHDDWKVRMATKNPYLLSKFSKEITGVEQSPDDINSDKIDLVEFLKNQLTDKIQQVNSSDDHLLEWEVENDAVGEDPTTIVDSYEDPLDEYLNVLEDIPEYTPASPTLGDADITWNL